MSVLSTPVRRHESSTLYSHRCTGNPPAQVWQTAQSLEQKWVTPPTVQIHWYQLPPYDFLQSSGRHPLLSKLGHQPLGRLDALLRRGEVGWSTHGPQSS